ncbi:glycosyltransferase involved in cell wall biosynthesis [Methylobacterium sp. OAE515]|uniref:glycosyltransferase n=1 Tax=Methylobacterium sp. OAE515 TaxID=2817895 RepID=UPI001789E36B
MNRTIKDAADEGFRHARHGALPRGMPLLVVDNRRPERGPRDRTLQARTPTSQQARTERPDAAHPRSASVRIQGSRPVARALRKTARLATTDGVNPMRYRLRLDQKPCASTIPRSSIMNDCPLKVTIAIPVYNGADFLRDAIESALNQTYKNIEIIVLDDGSTDGGRTRDIAASFGSAIRYIHQENAGVAGAMNHIIQVMSGDIFAWLSHDDLYFPQKIETQVEYFTAIGRRDAIIFSGVHYIDQTGRKIDESRVDHDGLIASPKKALLNSAINGCTLFIPVHILREFSPFDLTLKYTQDYDLWNKILTKYDFYYLPLPLIKYRIHPNQGTHRPAAVVEGDTLWVSIAERRTEAERALIAGSTQCYFEQLAAFLAKTPYKHAAVHVADEASTARQRARATVLLLVDEDVDSCLLAAASVLRQTHPNFELLLISHTERSNDQLSRWAARDERVKLLSFPKVDARDALVRASLYARGDYITFITEGALYLDGKLEKQIAHMQRNGLLLSWCAWVSLGPDQDDQPRTSARGCKVASDDGSPSRSNLSTLMVHRNLVCAGDLERMLPGSPDARECGAAARPSRQDLPDALVLFSETCQTEPELHGPDRAGSFDPHRLSNTPLIDEVHARR